MEQKQENILFIFYNNNFLQLATQTSPVRASNFSLIKHLKSFFSFFPFKKFHFPRFFLFQPKFTRGLNPRPIAQQAESNCCGLHHLQVWSLHHEPSQISWAIAWVAKLRIKVKNLSTSGCAMFKTARNEQNNFLLDTKFLSESHVSCKLIACSNRSPFNS